MRGERSESPSGGVAIVTAGTCRTGRELARGLARRGYAVVVVYLRDQREAEAAVEEILADDGAAVAVRADISDELDVERLFEETDAAFGGVDLVVHSTRGAPTAVVNRRAARRLRRGGAILDLAATDPVAPALATELRARDITINGLGPGVEPPGAHPGLAELLALVDRSDQNQDGPCGV